MHVDHIVPAGLLRYLAESGEPTQRGRWLPEPGGKPFLVITKQPNSEDPRNLLGICASCHGRKMPAEVALCAGRPRDYWRKLERLDWPMDRVRLALAVYGLDHGLGKEDF